MLISSGLDFPVKLTPSLHKCHFQFSPAIAMRDQSETFSEISVRCCRVKLIDCLQQKMFIGWKEKPLFNRLLISDELSLKWFLQERKLKATQ